LDGRVTCDSRRVFEAFLEELMWTPPTRVQHCRAGLRYGSNLTDGEWTILEPFCQRLVCAAASASGLCARSLMRSSTRCAPAAPGRCCPTAFPPPSTVYRWFARCRDDGTWKTVNHHLLMRDRERVGREASPTAAIMDNQSVETTEAGGPRRYDAGKKILGRKRLAMVDTDGRALKLHAHLASAQDRDGAGPLLKASRPRFPFIERVFADSGYAGPRVAKATRITVEIVRKQVGQVGFAVQPRRWVVERSSHGTAEIADWQRTSSQPSQSAEAFLCAASAMLLLRRLGRC
jgi:transposase